MRLGLMVGYSGATIELPLDMIKEADRLGFHSIWTAEAYGSDAVTPLAWIGLLECCALRCTWRARRTSRSMRPSPMPLPSY